MEIITLWTGCVLKEATNLEISSKGLTYGAYPTDRQLLNGTQHCYLPSQGLEERARMRPGTQSSLHPTACHFLQEGGGLESHSSPSAHQEGNLEISVPTQQPLLTTYKHTPLCTALYREVAPQCAVSHSPGQGGDHSCGPAVEPSPAADWPCARDRKPGRAVHACWTPDGLDARG